MKRVKSALSLIMSIVLVFSLTPATFVSAAVTAYHILVEPTLVFDDVYDGSFDENGLLQVKKDGKHGFINASGDVVVSIEYDIAENFSEGLARVYKGGKCGFVDTSGDVVVSMEYDFANSFSEGLASVFKDGKYGFVDTGGNVVVSMEYDFAGSFSEGLAWVHKAGKYGFIDTDGDAVGEIEYDDVGSFSGGFAWVRKAGKYGFIGTIGDVVVDIEYDFADSFSEGLARVRKAGKYGFIDTDGDAVGEIEYDDVGSFSGGFARVRKAGKYGFVDTSGDVVVDIEYDYVYSFSEGLASVFKAGKYGFVDTSGDVVVDIEYDFAGSFSEGLASVRKDGKYGFIDTDGDVVVDIEYDVVGSFSEGLARVYKDDKFGFVNTNGDVVVPIEYDQAFPFTASNGLAVVKKDGKYGILAIADVYASPSSYTFTPVAYGYDEQTEQIFTITNNSDAPLTNVTAALSGDTDSAFVITTDLLSDTIAANETATVSVRPKPDLPASEEPYEDTLVIAGDDLNLSVPLSFTVIPKPVIVAGVTAAKEYDGAVGFATDQIDISEAELIGNIDDSDLTLVKTGVTGTLPTADAGTTGDLALSGSFTLGGDAADNYTLSAQPAVTATITKASSGLTASGATVYIVENAEGTRTFDLNRIALAPSFGNTGAVTYALGAFDANDGVVSASPTLEDGVLTYTLSDTTTATSTSTQTVTVSTANFEDVTANIVFEVTDKTPVTISGISIGAKTYDGAAIAPQGEVSLTGNDEDPVEAGEDLIFTYIGTAADGTAYNEPAPPTKAGSYILYVTTNPADTIVGEVEIPFAITKATLTFAAANKTITVGDAEPAYTYTFSGIAVSDETEDVVLTVPTLSCPTYANAAGTYPIVPAGAELTTDVGANYVIAYVNGTLTVNARYSGPSYGSGFTSPTPTPTPTPTPVEEPDDTADSGDDTTGGDTNTAPEYTVSYNDVAEDAWYAGDVQYVTANGLMNGVGNENFSPNTTMTRAMLVTVLYRLAVGDGVLDVPNPDTTDFTDVPPGQWYSDAVAWAAGIGIVAGVGDNRFAPNAEITRQDLAVIFARYADALDITLTASRAPSAFSDDGDVASYAKDATALLYGAGVVNGKPGNLFDPRGSATRAEVAAMLHRFILAVG